jgi:hypothetical protein
MQDANWFDRLFQGGDLARGLSGSSGGDLALSDVNAFYNNRTRRHFVSGTIGQDPMLLWGRAAADPRPVGLWSHLEDVAVDGRPFTDVFIVLCGSDYDDGFQNDPQFDETVARLLGDAWDDLLRAGGLARAERRMGVAVFREGGPEMGGQDFGLLPGEFLTGVVPNLYRAPGATSRPVVALHVNLYGEWGQDYREVGRLYDDQLLFTMGNHWLDNFSHPALREPAIFSIRRDERGDIVHILNPDAIDRYQVTSQERDGISILTLATVQGEAIAYVVLWSTVDDGPVSVQDLDAGAMEPIDEPMPIREEIELEPVPRRPARTILSESHKDRIFTLQERGALFQKVHFSAFMLGYDVYLGWRGEVGTVVDDIAATFQIRKKTVSLHANGVGVSLNGEPVPRGEARVIDGNSVIEVGTQRLEYRDLRSVDVDGWPYVGEVRRPAASTYMLWGRTYSIGRSRECRVVLPDEPRNENIVWKAQLEGDTIHTKNGEVPKSRFYTDSIMVASEHAALELIGDTPQIISHARNCYTFVRRGERMLELFPTSSDKQPQILELEPGDEVMVGNCLFVATFTPADGRVVEPAPAPMARMTTDVLSDSVSLPDLAELDAPPPRHFALGTATGVEYLPDAYDDAPPPPKVEALPRARWPHSITDAPQRDPVAMTSGFPADELPRGSRTVSPLPTAQVMEGSRAGDRPLAGAPAVQPAPAPVAAAPPAAPAAPPAASADGVTAVHAAPNGVCVRAESDARIEGARPARLVLDGWMVQGTVTCGNHAGAEIIIPESRITPAQDFSPRDYFTLRVRGAKGQLELVDRREARLLHDPGAGAVVGAKVEVIRRDDAGDEDFSVVLTVVEDETLPDPRARLLRVHGDPLADALFCVGFPLRVERTIQVGPIHAKARFDGAALCLSDYLHSYQNGGAWVPFFVMRTGERSCTAPEDGTEIRLAAGDRLITGAAVWRVVG